MKKFAFITLISLLLLGIGQPAEACGLNKIKTGFGKVIHKIGSFTIDVAKEVPKAVAVTVATIELVPMILPLIIL